ncbi:Glutathione S-transferase 2 [Yamadazyma tenuis]|uniref:Glutathione S-transferase n=1 Tax=Candida tenuis (strain ATCC 10573 / BCRC 21748 / CBS 615 / JCM 9827 / NBRC 10315 / NRRL Y-1498 / VKM Y-70) TaxID=590646 RepID=G3B8A9_CANTC|nr:glutathione S-transferase [Yamadazyma tenuis ATCC 10573]EGV61728.1 glutathione S-transferase [Yamadazyma tenuis ATCC 10573]WEJ92960.1 Glutathione S-transferase 2 [Yamadazyma tenuis]
MSENITLYTAGSPNAKKVSIYLELLGLKYNIKTVDMGNNEQKSPEYLALNPNGKVPTLVDSSTDTTISESAAIMTYLSDKYDKDRKFSYEVGTKEYYKQLEIAYFQVGGIGPMEGEAMLYILFSSDDVPVAKERYRNETRRLYGVVEEYLKRNAANSPYFVGDHISIADVCVVTFLPILPRLGIEYDEFPLVRKWLKHMISIAEVVKGFNVPNPPPIWPEL